VAGLASLTAGASAKSLPDPPPRYDADHIGFFNAPDQIPETPL
jgi:hypothetical protein